eukprot:scaffold121968_cov12-Tisochrysis_lutea.AAC.1
MGTCKVTIGFDLQPGSLAAQPAGPAPKKNNLTLGGDLQGSTVKFTIRVGICKRNPESSLLDLQIG